MKNKTIAAAFNQIAVGPGEKFLVGSKRGHETYEKVPLQNGHLLVHYHFNNSSPSDSCVFASLIDGNKLTVLEPKNMTEIDRALITDAYAMGAVRAPLKEFLDPKPH
jgi:hypothetical protein